MRPALADVDAFYGDRARVARPRRQGVGSLLRRPRRPQARRSQPIGRGRSPLGLLALLRLRRAWSRISGRACARRAAGRGDAAPRAPRAQEGEERRLARLAHAREWTCPERQAAGAAGFGGVRGSAHALAGAAARGRAAARTPARAPWLDTSHIEALGLGFDGERITFPIRAGSGELLDVLRYKPSKRAEGERKLLASKGRPRGLFPTPESVDGDPIWVLEGEADAVSARELGIAATAVPGVKKWDESWSERFAGRGVVVMLDCDDEGREAAQRISESLLPHAAAVKVLDLDSAREDGYDLSDFLLEAGEERDEARRVLLTMALKAPRLEPSKAVDGAALLDEIVGFYRRFVLMSPVRRRSSRCGSSTRMRSMWRRRRRTSTSRARRSGQGRPERSRCRPNSSPPRSMPPTSPTQRSFARLGSSRRRCSSTR